jgi:ribose transport system ATP-binding protein
MVETALILAGVVLKSGARAFDERLRGGEIVGFAGLHGHGQETALAVAAGLERPAGGEISLERGGERAPLRGFAAAARRGVAYLPRDRRAAGIFPNLSVLDNFAIASLSRDLRGGFISLSARRARFEAFRERLSIAAHDLDGSIARLSGGNQQKVLLARLLARDPLALLLNDPTRGVDVATRGVLYRFFRELAGEGMALALVSSEIEELASLCDRVLVFREHSLFARLEGGRLTAAAVVAAMFGEAA